MNTYCFKIYYNSVDADDIIYVGADSKKEAISLIEKQYGQIDYEFLGQE